MEQKPFKGQLFTEPSMTEPRMHYTIPELVAKHNCGHMPEIGRHPQWMDDDISPIYRQWDYDITELGYEVSVSIQKVKDVQNDIELKNQLKLEVDADSKRLNELLLQENSDKPLKYSELQELKELRRKLKDSKI